MKLITVITATYNSGKHLQNCLNSIIPQKKSNIELVIIDGNSKDETKDIIKLNEQYIDYWVSETDLGIYDAWNKGLAKANGQWIMFLGSDDQLALGALSIYENFIKKNSTQNYDLISSKLQMINSKGFKGKIIGQPYEWSKFLKGMLIAHPGALHSKLLFTKYGQFNTEYKITGDYEFLLRAGASLKTAFVNEITVFMGEGGASESIEAIKEANKAVKASGHSSTIKSNYNSLIVMLKFILKKYKKMLSNIFN